MVDSVRVFDPLFRVTDSNGDPVNGAKIKFYAAGTTTPRTVYSDSGLSSSLGSIVYCGSDGLPVASQGSSTEVIVYTGTTAYKVVITDDSDVEIATYDNISGALDTSDFLTSDSASTLSLPVVVKTSDYTIVAADNGKVINANSTGGDITLTLTNATTLGDNWNVLVKHNGTANRVIISTNQTLAYGGTTATSYVMAVGETVQIVCDAAGFHVINAISFPVLPAPQGYLTPVSGTPVITSDSTAATAIYYTPKEGTVIPVWNGVRFMPRTFSEMTLSLAASHSASSLYDVFCFSDSGTLRLVTGPVWSTLTAGSGSRGTGAGTTELTRSNGFWVNAVAMTARNGNTTYSVPAGYGTYVGTIFTDSTPGQVTCHRSYGQSRKWGIWNAYNRQPITLRAGDSSSTWTTSSSTFRAINNSSANSLTLLVGLQEEEADITSCQYHRSSTNIGATGSSTYIAGIGYNSTTAASGTISQTTQGQTNSNFSFGAQQVARYVALPSIGLNVVTALEKLSGSGSMFNGGNGEESNSLIARWRG